ncbi:MAG TPA: hypothetical protein VMS64_24375 [Candidatus Methylomirabilis sp.]|nr:hypothetical protein [Candidatus Methylomirabilis sp.]
MLGGERFRRIEGPAARRPLVDHVVDAEQAHHRLRVEVAAQLVAIADRDDPAAQHGQSRRTRPHRIHGLEPAALEDQIHAHGMPMIARSHARRDGVHGALVPTSASV